MRRREAHWCFAAAEGRGTADAVGAAFVPLVSWADPMATDSPFLSESRLENTAPYAFAMIVAQSAPERK